MQVYFYFICSNILLELKRRKQSKCISTELPLLSEDEVRHMFKLLKSMGSVSPEFYAHWAFFEISQGRVGKGLSILQTGVESLDNDLLHRALELANNGDPFLFLFPLQRIKREELQLEGRNDEGRREEARKEEKRKEEGRKEEERKEEERNDEARKEEARREEERKEEVKMDEVQKEVKKDEANLTASTITTASSQSNTTLRLKRLGLGPPVRTSPIQDEEYKIPPTPLTNFNYAVPVMATPIQTDDKSTVIVNGQSYKVLEMIGKGGSSKVYKIIQNSQLFALKRVKLKGLDKATLGGYINEISHLQELKGSPFIINLHDFEINRESGYLFMILEFGEIDLARLLKQQSRKSLNFIRNLWQQMLEIVDFIHKQRIVHCDLKPANFLLVKGTLKLIDFGISKTIMNDTTNIVRDSQVGTVNYMSPEALAENSSTTRKLKIGRPSDVWSLGCILYEIVYDKPPFALFSSLVLRLQKIMDPSYEIEYPSDSFVTASLKDAIQKCLIRSARERWTIPQLLQHQLLHPQEIPLDSVVVSKSKLEFLVEQVMKLKQDQHTNVNMSMLSSKIVQLFIESNK